MPCREVQCDVMGLLGEGMPRVAGSVCDTILYDMNMCAFIKARMKCRVNIGNRGWCSQLWGWVEKCVL